jgi:glutamate-ammonia-ligase adenylyltransferase
LEAIPNAEKIFQGLLSQIRKKLSPIEIDCRLRPEGKSSILVWDIKNYELYIQKRLRVWELQAFTKISMVCGSANLFNIFLELLKTRLKTEKSSTIANEIKEMRRKMYPANLGGKMSMLNLKKSPGGLVDPEFIAQYLVLLSIDNFPQIAGKGVKIIANLSGNDLTLSDSETLLKNYSFLKRLDFLNQVIFNATTSILPSDKKKLSMISKHMGFDDPENFRLSLNEIMKSNKILFQKYLAAN